MYYLIKYKNELVGKIVDSCFPKIDDEDTEFIEVSKEKFDSFVPPKISPIVNTKKEYIEESQDTETDLMQMAIDHEYRLILLELGIEV